MTKKGHDKISEGNLRKTRGFSANLCGRWLKKVDIFRCSPWKSWNDLPEYTM